MRTNCTIVQHDFTVVCLVLNIKNMCRLHPCKKKVLASNRCSYLDPIVRPSTRHISFNSKRNCIKYQYSYSVHVRCIIESFWNYVSSQSFIRQYARDVYLRTALEHFSYHHTCIQYRRYLCVYIWLMKFCGSVFILT
jgi:hypothetical protein